MSLSGSTVRGADLSAAVDSAALARRAQLGDVEAFETLYRAHGPRVRALCMRLCGDERRAEEAAQDAWVRVWERISTWRGESAFATWLHRVTVNVVLGGLRSERRRLSRVRLAEEDEEFDAEQPTGDRAAAMDLEEAIARLPRGARTVFVLHDVEGYQHNEIAAMTGLAEGTLRAQLCRARRLLMGMLER